MRRYVNLKIVTKRCIAIGTIAMLGHNSSFAQYAAPGSKLSNFFVHELQSHGVPVVNQGSAQIQPLSRINPRADTTQTNLAYWLETLPQAYKNFREYVLIRKYGALIPIINPSAEDRAAIDRGEVVPTDHYLARGAFRHFGKKPNQSNGNFVLAAHSSDELSAAGSFKTAFMPLLLLGPGDTIDYYTRNGDNYVRYEYSIFTAEVTDPSNSSIMAQPTDKARLTAYSCWPLGSTKQRRYIQAGLIQTEKGVLETHSPAEQNDKAEDTIEEEKMDAPEQAHESAPEDTKETIVQDSNEARGKMIFQDVSKTEEKRVEERGTESGSGDRATNSVKEIRHNKKDSTVVEITTNGKEGVVSAPSIANIKQQPEKNSYTTTISMIVQENTITPMRRRGVLGLYVKLAKTVFATITNLCLCRF